MSLASQSEMHVRPATLNRPWRLGVQSFLGGLFLAMLIATGLALTLVGYRIVAKGAERSAIRRSQTLTRAIVRELDLSVHAQIKSFINQAAHSTLGQADTLEKRLEFLPMLLQVRQASYFVKGVVLGFDNGDAFLAILLETEEERKLYGAPPGSSLVVLDCHGPVRLDRARELFFDQDLNLKGERDCPGIDQFDSQNRGWFTEAMLSDNYVETGPFFFHTIQKHSLVVSKKSVTSEKAVVGMLVDLQQVSKILSSELPTNGSVAVLFNGGGNPIADSHQLANGGNGTDKASKTTDFPPVIQQAMALYSEGKRGDNLDIMVDGSEWLVSVEDLKQFAPINYTLAVAIPKRELFDEAGSFIRASLIELLGLLLLTMTSIWLVGRNVGRPLQSLAEQASRPPASGNERHHHLDTGVVEIRALASGVKNLHGELRKILGLLDSMGAEMDMSRLLDQVIREIVAMVDVDGGILVLWDGRSEVPSDVRAFWRDAEVEDLVYPRQNQSPKLVAYEAMVRGITMESTVYRDEPRAMLGPMRPAFKDESTLRVDAICVPLRDRRGSTLGSFCLIKRIDENTKNNESFPPALKEFSETLAGAIGIVLETRTLIKGQQDIRDALIHILAGAIDTKSTHTGGHCARVPVIFHHLLQAAHDAQDGAMQDFHLDQNGWEAARLAAWLHDCGKVTTPEFVVNKATKLETLYDRIHEIRTRFEVLKRDVEIASLRAMLAGADQATEQRKMEEAFRCLDEEFAFVASCNRGGEYLDEDDAARLEAIGSRSWLRTLDKRLGVSRAELERMEQAGVEPGPTCEMLLADQPEQIIPRSEKDRIPADNKWGFKLQMPEALYNRGELHNLLIPRGTLTAEERYKINDHITQTIIMLEKLPLTKELADVPKIAGAHHERMDGKGYPRGLVREEMNLPGRMLAIADIFEALTASDRPYKTSKKLSEALQIMEEMKENGHIDPDLYDLFIKAEIPQRYAAEYLSAEQNDM